MEDQQRVTATSGRIGTEQSSRARTHFLVNGCLLFQNEQGGGDDGGGGSDSGSILGLIQPLLGSSSGVGHANIFQNHCSLAIDQFLKPP